jgi:anaerobic magnesium-protoporphyrin IX monomethyl ester cyclase
LLEQDRLAMQVCLVRPPILVPRNHPIVQFTPPLGIAYLAGTLRAAGIEVSVVDGLGSALDERHPADNNCYSYGLHPDEVVRRIPESTRVIGISAAFSFEWPTCRDLIGRIRRQFPKAILVGGGEHITALPELSLQESDLDIAVLGEGEEVLLNLVRALAVEPVDLSTLTGIYFKGGAGEIVRTPSHGRIRNIDDIPLPAWDSIPIEEYLDRGMGFGVNRGRSMPVLASRGCPFQCTFCSSPQMWTTRWIPRDPDKLLDELEQYQKRYQITNFDFYDLTAIVKKKWIVEFCRKIKQRGLKFTWQLPSGTRSEAIDGEVAELLYLSGCRNLSYSPESGSLSVLTRIKKRIDPVGVLNSMRSSVEAGLNVKCNLIIGFPGETYREIAETFRFVGKLALVGVHDVSIWVFSPYPGSELFDELHAAGVIKINEQYYDDLRSYADTTRTKSFTDTVPSSVLKFLRRVGTAFFYVAAWTRRPWRPFVMIRNIVRGTQESRSELALSTVFKRATMKTVIDTQPQVQQVIQPPLSRKAAVHAKAGAAREGSG